MTVPLHDLIGEPMDYGPALSFYGPEAFKTILRQEVEEREFQRLKRETAADRVDDVAGQVAEPTP